MCFTRLQNKSLPEHGCAELLSPPGGQRLPERWAICSRLFHALPDSMGSAGPFHAPLSFSKSLSLRESRALPLNCCRVPALHPPRLGTPRAQPLTRIPVPCRGQHTQPSHPLPPPAPVSPSLPGRAQAQCWAERGFGRKQVIKHSAKFHSVLQV